MPWTQIDTSTQENKKRFHVPTGTALLVVAFFSMFSATLLWQSSVESESLDPPQRPAIVLGDMDMNTDPVMIAPTSTPWWNPDWQHRVSLNFDARAVAEDLSDIPVLVQLDGTRFSYASTTEDGSDLRFVYATSTVLDYDRESWNTSATSTFWVKIPEVTAATTTGHAWLYYGYTGEEPLTPRDDESGTHVWDEGFEMVHHYTEATEAVVDTVDKHNGRAWGTQSGATGFIGAAHDFDGVNDYIDLGGFSLPGDTLTLEAWVKPDDFGVDTARIISKSDSVQTQGHMWALTTMPITTLEGARVIGTRFMLNADGRTHVLVNDSIPLDDSVWSYVVATYDGNAMRLYHNGVLSAVREQSGGRPEISFSGVAIGNQPPGSLRRAFDGVIDEVRISSVARSAAWVAAQYLSMNDVFITYGTPESFTATTTATTTQAYDESGAGL